MSIQTVTFNCEVITPMFLAGADQNKPELRAPSIRGAMRWWFRAMMGGIIGNKLDDLSKLESMVFGNPDIGSAINVRIKRDSAEKPKTSDQPRLPHKTTQKEKAIRKAIDTKEQFDIELSLRPGIHHYRAKILETAKHSLILLLACGGVGTRSRRGFGCVTFSINRTDYESKSVKEVFDEASTSFRSLLSDLSISAVGWGTTLPPFPCIVKDHFEVWTANANGNWADELKRLMNTMSDYTADGKSNNSKNENAIGGVQKVYGKTHRLSSPLIVHARKVTDDKVQLVFSHFRMAPHGAIGISKANSDALDSFLQKNIDITKVGVFP